MTKPRHPDPRTALVFVRRPSDGYSVPIHCSRCDALAVTRYLRGRTRNTYYCDDCVPKAVADARALRPIKEIQMDPPRPHRRPVAAPTAPAPAADPIVAAVVKRLYDDPETERIVATPAPMPQRYVDAVVAAVSATWTDAFALGAESADQRVAYLRSEVDRLTALADARLADVKRPGLTERDREELLRKLAHAEAEIETLGSRIKAQSAALVSVRAENADLRSKVDELKKENLALVDEALSMMDSSQEYHRGEQQQDAPSAPSSNGSHEPTPDPADAAPAGSDRAPRRVVIAHEPLADVLAKITWNGTPSTWRLAYASERAEKTWKALGDGARRQVRVALDRYAQNPSQALGRLPVNSKSKADHPNLLVMRAGQLRVLLQPDPTGRTIYDIVSRGDHRVFTHEA